jgi:hypothetical protein
MQISLKIHVIASDETEAAQWVCLLETSVGVKARRFCHSNFRHLASDELFGADLWIIQVWHALDILDPVGFRTAILLTGERRILLVFGRRPSTDFPHEGPFWITYSFARPIKDKIHEIMKGPPVRKEELEALAQEYPALLYMPSPSHP